MSMRMPAWARPADILDLLKLSGPIAISRMAMMLMSVTDAVVLGQFAPGQLPFILNAWLPIGVCLGFGMGILLGTQVMTSELLGIGREAESGRIFRRSLWASIGIGLVLMGIVYVSTPSLFHWLFVEIAPPTDALNSVPPEEIARRSARTTRIVSLAMVGFMVSTACSYYLEALRRPMLVTLVMYFGAVVNLFIDLALVAGWWGLPQMGAEGVAWATTGSRWALTIVMMGLVIWLTPAFKRSPPGPHGEARRQFAIGGGTAISNIAEFGGFNSTFIIATWISLAANTIYGYAFQIIGLAFMFYLGVATATSVRVAEAFGRENAAEVRDAGRLGVAAGLLLGLMIAAVLSLFGGPISTLLVKEDAVMDGVQLAPALAGLMLLAAMVTIFDGLQATASFALRAQEIVWWPSVVHVSSFFVLMMPACYVFGITLGYGAKGMMMGALLACFTAGIIQLILLESLSGRKIGKVDIADDHSMA